MAMARVAQNKEPNRGNGLDFKKPPARSRPLLPVFESFAPSSFLELLLSTQPSFLTEVSY